MLVYHGSTQKVKKPNVKYTKRNLDFGRGFYITKIKSQAKRWAIRKKLILGKKTAIVNIYNLKNEYIKCKYKLFKSANDEWLDFVCDCRDGKNNYKKFDVIEGPVANDKVYTVVDMYRKNIWDKKRTLKELKFYKISNQICFIKQSIMDKYLEYVDSEEASNDK